MSTRTSNAAKKSTAKGNAKTATKVKPIEALATPEKTQKSIRVYADLDQLPNGKGGVRFAEEAAKDGSVVLGKVYIGQPSFALLDKSKRVRITIEAV